MGKVAKSSQKLKLKQYTIRGIPNRIDRILQHRAQESGKSFNQIAIDALILGTSQSPIKRDLTGIAGSMTESEALRIEGEVKIQNQIDLKLWQ